MSTSGVRLTASGRLLNVGLVQWLADKLFGGDVVNVTDAVILNGSLSMFRLTFAEKKEK